MRSPGRLTGACSVFLGLILASGCNAGTTPAAAPTTPTATAPASQAREWVPVDIPGLSEFRSAIYDHARECIWVVSREFGPTPDDIFATLDRINAVDRSTIRLPLHLNAEGYDVGVMALDAQDVLWMAWGNTLTRYDPNTAAAKQWTLPPYSGLARLYSTDGRIDAMTISSDGEIWLAAGMVSAVYGFNPKSETWDRPINLTFVSIEGRTVLASPMPGVVTINGLALAGGAVDPSLSPRFAVIMTATRNVTTLSLPVVTYVAIGGGQIVYSDRRGRLVRYNIAQATTTVVATTPPYWGTNAPMVFALDGNVWLPFTTEGFPGVARLNPSTGVVTQFPFPIVIRYFEPRPSPSPGQFCPPHACSPVLCKPAVVFRCVPTPISLNPNVQGLAPDAYGNVWLVTQAGSAGSRNPDSSIFAPVVELQPNA